MNKLITSLQINKFDELINYWQSLDTEFKILVDGGAGLGETADQMLLASNHTIDKILAFEPNPPNVAAFQISDKEKIELIPSALGARNGEASFQVTSMTKNLTGSKYLVSGTSFVGKIVESDNTNDNVLVPIVRLEDTMQDRGLDKLDFLKLDLQGGELAALNGVGKYLETVKLMWVEFTGQPGLLSFLHDAGFTVFDTEYLFVGKPNHLIEELFEITRVGRNSIGKDIFFGYRKHSWDNYEAILDFMKRRRRLVQTDIVVVNNKYISQFHEFSKKYGINTKKSIPDIIKDIK